MRIRDLVKIFKVKHEDTFSKGIKLQVVENEDVKLFNLDGVTNSKINKRSIYTGGYWDYFIPIVYAYRDPKILMIGLGIGTIPYQLHSLFVRKIKIDIVEYDQQVVRLARKYSPGELKDRIFVEDGYDYVSKTEKKYDVLILDAYGKGANIPNQFFSAHFIENVNRILRKDGVLVINYAMHPAGMFKFRNYKKLLSKFFKVYKIDTMAMGDTSIILCSKRMKKEELVRRVKTQMKKNKSNSAILKSYELMRDA